MSRILLLTFLVTASSVLQAQIEWTSSFENCFSFSSPRTSDLNGDGVLDIVIGAGIDGTPVDNGFLAINGVNGETLWSIPSDDQVFGSATFLAINNDGIDDVILAGRNAILKAIDGSTGATIWDFYTDTVVPPGDLGYWNFYNSQVIPDQDGDGNLDILVSNGGNHELPNFETDRPPGHIMVISGASGAELAFAQVPDGRETYMSPLVLDFDEDGELDVIYGTGGEFIQGSLYRTTLSAVLSNDISGSTVLLTSETNGFIAPPSLVDINLDGVSDIIVNAYDGRVVALNGADNSIIWTVPVSGAQTNSSPAIGFFNDDSIPDVFSTYAVGQAPTFTSYIQMMIDGATGTIAWEDALGIFHFTSPLVYDLDEDGIDEVIQTINQMDGANFSNSVLAIDFNDSSVNTLVGPNPGVNINATPWIGNLDQDGILDLVTLSSIGTTFVSFEDGINVVKESLDGISDASIVPWGAYLGTNYDGQYTSPQVDCFFSLDISSNNNVCFDGNSGLAAVVSTGCPNPEDCSYLWSNGSTEQLVSNLPAGTFTVDVTHPNGCVLSGLVTITAPSSSPFSLSTTDATCANQSDGSISIENLDPSFNYEFNWSNGATTATQDELPVGNYSVFFTDQFGCFIQLATEVSSTPSVDFVLDFQNISCFGDSDASISIDSLTGLDPITISWTGDFIGSDMVLENLDAGSYNLEIVDGSGCNFTQTFEVIEPDDLVLDIEIIDESCEGMSDGSVTAEILGGTPPFTIIWEGNFIGPTFSELFVRGNLPAGTYNLEVRDWSDCNVNLNIPVASSINIETEFTAASGFGVSDGAITIDAENGTAPFVISINGNEETFNSLPQVFDNLTGGDEIVISISDDSGCDFAETIIVPFGAGIINASIGLLGVYPNPVRNEAFLTIPEDISCLNYQVYDNSGQLAKGGSFSRGTTLNMSDLPKGLYYIEVFCQKTRLGARLVKL